MKYINPVSDIRENINKIHRLNEFVDTTFTIDSFLEELKQELITEENMTEMQAKNAIEEWLSGSSEWVDDVHGFFKTL